MYKLEDGKLVKAPNAIYRLIDGINFITTNPTEQMLSEKGYKHLEEQEKPEIGAYQELKESYEDIGTVIVHKWEVIDLPTPIEEPIEEGIEDESEE